MHIALITTYPPQHCGIATYSYKLQQAFVSAGHQVSILAESVKGEQGGIWVRGFPLDAVRDHLRGLHPDIVHIQHEFGLFPNTLVLASLIHQIKSVPTALTLHTVEAPPVNVGFFATINTNFIVHSYPAQAVLADRIKTHVNVIPHGVTLVERCRSNPSPQVVILCPGFVSASKNHEEILEAFAFAVGKLKPPLPRLLIVGECRDAAYYMKVESAIAKYGLQNLVLFKAEYTADPATLYSYADIVILGAKDTSPYSASGQLHDAIGAGVPVLAKNVPIYRTGTEGVLLYDTPEELTTFMTVLVENAMIRNQLAAEARKTAEERTWAKVAEKHIAAYAKIIDSTRAKT